MAIKARKIEKKEKAYNPFEANLNATGCMESFNKLDESILNSRFKLSQDPINYAFEALEYVPLQQLAIDFIKESFMDVVEFISKIK